MIILAVAAILDVLALSQWLLGSALLDSSSEQYIPDLRPSCCPTQYHSISIHPHAQCQEVKKYLYMFIILH
jgi:hypothetical protein